MVSDRIISSVPVNKTAARVLGRGVHWEPAPKMGGPNQLIQDVPPPTFPVPHNTPGSVFIGTKINRLTVIGYGGRVGNGAVWVVRCTCGKYEHRRTKYLRSETAKARAMCSACDYLEYLKQGPRS